MSFSVRFLPPVLPAWPRSKQSVAPSPRFAGGGDQVSFGKTLRRFRPSQRHAVGNALFKLLEQDPEKQRQLRDSIRHNREITLESRIKLKDHPQAIPIQLQYLPKTRQISIAVLPVFWRQRSLRIRLDEQFRPTAIACSRLSDAMFYYYLLRQSPNTYLAEQIRSGNFWDANYQKAMKTELDALALYHDDQRIRQVKPDALTGDFIKTALVQVARLPSAILNFLTEHYQVVLAPFIVEAFPDLQGRAAQGHGTGFTWNAAVGIHVQNNSSPHCIGVAENYYQFEDGQPSVFVSLYPDHTVRHEVGHMIDGLQGYKKRFSNQPQFIWAYQTDLAAMSEKNRKKLDYLLPGPDELWNARLEEVFAEVSQALLAVHQQPNVISSHNTRLLTHFNHTAIYAKRQIKRHFQVSLNVDLAKFHKPKD